MSYADAVDKAMDIEEGLQNHGSRVRPQVVQGNRPMVPGVQPSQSVQSSLMDLYIKINKYMEVICTAKSDLEESVLERNLEDLSNRRNLVCLKEEKKQEMRYEGKKIIRDPMKKSKKSGSIKDTRNLRSKNLFRSEVCEERKIRLSVKDQMKQFMSTTRSN
ncbi:pentatricopeptide repeat-containing protein mitochondrial [Dorcoceras hygrometricum]|uniref:Pentatricopeptide repeat-containing protein mitochondrial n=1 Tax=Dorcoceras hygrometricum TaxID=472368 RepID=A0A2Z7A5U7_9LAMI|nr:pentatricopeptide repeat-containing protein mitochondrial [Dorcoceras hygrometricum]